MLSMIIIPIQAYPQYVKKAELDSFLQRQTKGIRTSISVGFVGLILAQILVPSIFIGAQIKFAMQMPILITSLLLGLGGIIYTLTTNTLDSERVNNLKKDNSDLITINGPLINKKLQWFFIAYLVISSLAIVTAVILPVYNGAS